MKGKNILVTGGAGFIGSNLVEALLHDNKVTVLDNLHTGSISNLKLDNAENLKIITADVTSAQSMIDHFDVVFHLGFFSASPMYRDDPHRTAQVIDGMISVLEYARKNDCSVVYSSTSSIYNGIKPPHKEGIIPGVTDFYTEGRIGTERIAELYNKLYGLNVSAMRFFSVYGYREDAKGGYANLATQFFKAMKKGEQPVIYGDGEQRRDFVFVTDVVDALTRATDSKGFEVYNVGSGKNYSLNELVVKINGILGTDIKGKYIEMPVKNYVMETLADTSKSQEKLGFKAKVNLDEGLKLLAEYYSL